MHWGKWRLTCCASQNFLEFAILLSLLLALHTTFNYAFIVLVVCKAPQQNFPVHVKGSLYSRMSFQEERRHITPTIGVRSLPLLRCRPTSSPFNSLWSTYVWADDNIHLMLCFTMGNPQVGIFFKCGAKVSYLPLRPLILQMSPLSSFTLHTIFNCALFSFLFL